MPYSHPTIVNPLTVFGRNVSRTGDVFAGLGCPNGCGFCCTSHFYRRKHIRLLPTGADIYAVIQRYMKLDPEMSIIILDEDFLLNRKRAFEFRDCVLRDGKALSIFCFAKQTGRPMAEIFTEGDGWAPPERSVGGLGGCRSASMRLSADLPWRSDLRLSPAWAWLQHPRLIRHTYCEEEKVRSLVLQSDNPFSRITRARLTGITGTFWNLP